MDDLSLREALAPSDMSDSTVLWSCNGPPCSSPTLLNSTMYFRAVMTIDSNNLMFRGTAGCMNGACFNSVTVLVSPSPVTENWLLKSSSTAARTVSRVCESWRSHSNWWANSSASISIRRSGRVTEQEMNARRRSGERPALLWGKDKEAKQMPGVMPELSVSPSHGSEEVFVSRACWICWIRVDIVCRTAGERLSTHWSSSQHPKQEQESKWHTELK